MIPLAIDEALSRGMIYAMLPASRMAEWGWRAKSFDVMCVGDPLWKVTQRGPTGSSKAPQMSPGGAPVTVALALAREGLQVGLTTVLTDDPFGHASAKRIAAAGVDVDGVAFARQGRGFVIVDAGGGANEAPSDAAEEPLLEVPQGWS